MHYTRIVEGYIDGLRDAFDDGEISDIDPTVAAWALMGIGEMIGMRWVLWGDPDSAPGAGADPTASGTREVPPHVLDEMMRFIGGALGRPETARPGSADAPQRGGIVTDLSGRRAVVTGGASGIGEACARAFAAAGAHVVIADLNGEAAERVARDVGGEAWQVDLGDTAALADLTLDADILVNNAGIQHVRPIEQFEPERFALILRLMLESPFLLIRAALPGMYERGFGRVINISSVHGLRASPFKSAYVAAKHGLEGLSKVTALEGGPHGVTSNCINPGYVRTPLVEKQIADQARLHGITEDEVLPQDHADRVGRQAPRRARRGRESRALAREPRGRHGDRGQLHDGRRMERPMTETTFAAPVAGGVLAGGQWRADAPGLPVLAVHGITASHRNWDLVAAALPDERVDRPRPARSRPQQRPARAVRTGAACRRPRRDPRRTRRSSACTWSGTRWVRSSRCASPSDTPIGSPASR